MNKIFSVIFFITSIVSTYGQQYRNPVVDNGMVYSLNNRVATTLGSVYLNDEWKQAKITLKNDEGKFLEVPVKLDLKTNVFEISLDNNVKVLEGSKVSYFQWFNPNALRDERYLNCDRYTLDGAKASGFCKVLSDSGLMLVERAFVEVIKANYNVQLNVGSQDDRIEKKEKLYLISKNQMIPYEKRTFFEILGDKADVVKRYVKENKLNIAKADGIKRAVDYYNSI